MAGGGNEEGEFGLQIAPILDLLFVLLIFFMSSAGAQVKEAELGIKIPGGKSSASQEETNPPAQLDINAMGQVYLNQAPVDTPNSKDMPGLKAQLKELVAKFTDKQPVIIAPSSVARHERIVDVLNACSAAGVKNLAFGTSSM
ncbi:MAG: biopolymer transporter ExbD [Verrucomicrobiota bacterium]